MGKKANNKPYNRHTPEELINFICEEFMGADKDLLNETERRIVDKLVDNRLLSYSVVGEVINRQQTEEE